MVASHESSARWRESLPGVWCVDVNHPALERTCCYLLIDKNSGKAALIDCGAQQGIANIVAATEALGIAREQLEWIVVTHTHMDHCGAAGNLLEIFPQAKLAGYHAALYHLINPQEKLTAAVRDLFGARFYEEQYAGIVAADKSRTHVLSEGDEITIGGKVLQVLYTPGHAWHHIVLHDVANDVAFTGDAYGVSYLPAGASGLLVTPVMPPTHFAPEEAIASLRRLRDLNVGKVALTHFDVIENRPAYADLQIRALTEWMQAACEINEKDDDFMDSFLSYLHDWYQTAATALGLDIGETARLHKNDHMLTAKGFAHWLEKDRS